jgi:thiamine transport system ATP-binding protein
MLEVRNAVKMFDETVALDGADLVVRTGEVLAILGPSGCGKSTLLRAIAGLDSLDSGTISWDGTDLSGAPVHRRRFGLMFQGYALFPHKSVGENVGFGLKMQGIDRHEIAPRVEEALRWVGMSGFADRSVEGLSGGEQQRVALARTLAPEPRLVMLDEPLGALDRTLRERLATETRDLLRRRRATVIYVTHDHDEANTIAGDVAIMRAGRIVQIGPLEDIRSSPVDAWTADFVG